MPADAPESSPAGAGALRCACLALCACHAAVDAPGDLCPSCGRGFHVMPPMGALLAELAADPEGVAAALRRACRGTERQ